MDGALKSRIEAKARGEKRTASAWAQLVLEERLDSGVPAGRDSGTLTASERLLLDAVGELPEPVQRAIFGLSAKSRHNPKLCQAVTSLEEALPIQGNVATRSRSKGRTVGKAKGTGR